MLVLVLATACRAPDPYQPLSEGLSCPLSDGVRAELPASGLFVVLRARGTHVVVVGDQARELALPLPTGDRDPALEEALAPLAEPARHEAWVLYERSMPEQRLRGALASLVEAGLYEPHLVALGPRDQPVSRGAPRPDRADPTVRPDPWLPLRIGLLDGVPAYRIDDRQATFEIDLDRDELGLDFATLVEDPSDPPLWRSYADAAGAARYPVLPGVEMLAHLSKRVDDELVAAVTRAREPAVRAWLDRALQASEELRLDAARDWLQAARALGNGEPAPAARAFLDDPVRSLPVGLYGEAPDLGRVFQRDRWLAEPLDEPLSRELARLLQQDAGVREGLEAMRAHQAVWTNPANPAQPTVDVPGRGRPRLVAQARSREATFARTLPEEAPVMDAWIAALRTGAASLEPAPDSGWYDRQEWALAPLLDARSEKLLPGEAYARRLEDAFRAMIALRRETHVKDLASLGVGAGQLPPVVARVAPELRVEPLPEHYEREAAVVSWLLEVALADAPVDGALRAREVEVGQRYREAAAVARADLGMAGEPPPPEPRPDGLSELLGAFGASAPPEMAAKGAPPAAPALRPPGEVGPAAPPPAWLEGWRADPVLGQDVRVVVPVREEEGGVRAWAVLGVRPLDIVVRYQRSPHVETLEGRPIALEPQERRYTLLVPVFSEVVLARPLDRAAFRALADQHPRAASLVAALEGRAPAVCP